jgi:hypothetical protein
MFTWNDENFLKFVVISSLLLCLSMGAISATEDSSSERNIKIGKNLKRWQVK